MEIIDPLTEDLSLMVGLQPEAKPGVRASQSAL